MNLQRIAIASALTAASLGASSVAAADPISTAPAVAVAAGTKAATSGAEQRLREDLRVLLLDMIESGAFGDTPPDQIALTIDEPRQRVGNLGVLVDSSSGERAHEGLRVLGTTPGSSAERIGLRSGDVLVTVNGDSLAALGSDGAGSARAAGVLRDRVDTLEDGAPVRFDVRRGGQMMALSGALAATWIPAVRVSIGGAGGTAAVAGSGCGRISTFDVAPRQDKLHEAMLISIDGRLAGVQGQQSFRVEAGQHVVEIAEKIENRYLGINDRQRSAGKVYKRLTIEVAPGTTYHVAAKLDEDKRTQWKDGAYWEPVVWRESSEACR